MVNLARALVSYDQFDIDLVVARAEGPYLPLVPPEVRVIDLKVNHALQGVPGLARYFRTERPDSVLSSMERSNLAAIWARRRSGIVTRLVISVHNTLSVHSREATHFKERIVPIVARRAYRDANTIVTVSADAAEDLCRFLRLDRERVVVIYNPVVSDALLESAGCPTDHPWFADNQPPVVLSVGRLTPQKDFPHLLRAFARARQQRQMRLLILGEGAELGRLEALARDLGISGDVQFPGFLDNPYRFMSRCAVFALSSQWEGLPTVLIEALACGAPVVSTDCPSGPREILDGGRYGGLVPMNDVESLSASILRAVEGGIKPAPQEAWSRFRIDHAARQYLCALFPDMPAEVIAQR